MKTTEIDGDLAVKRNASAGGDFIIGGDLVVKGDLRVEGWTDAAMLRGVCKGLFGSSAALRNRYPLPEEGWWAMVGSTVPADIWMVAGGTWQATGQKGGSPMVELPGTSSTDSLAQRLGLFEAALDDMQTQLTALQNRVKTLENS